MSCIGEDCDIYDPPKTDHKRESSPKDGTWWGPHEALLLNRGSDRY